MKRTAKIWGKLIVSIIVIFETMIGMVWMYHSSDFIPVYDVAGNWHLGSQLIRYGLYAILGANCFYAVYTACRAWNYLARRIRRWVRRYYR